MALIADYEKGLSRRVLEGFREIDPAAITCYGLTDPDRCGERDPTFAFEVSGQTAFETKKLLWEGHGLQIADGNHYSAAVVRHLRKPALCRASFAHYDTAETVDAFLAALKDVSGVRPG
jgi:selenocysteine lyase/cysteine desulfurase